MQVRHLSSEEKYTLQVLEDHDIQQFLQKHTSKQNEILLYPVNSNCGSSTGARNYNACFIVHGMPLLDNNKLVEVSMGNLSPVNLNKAPERILQALNFLKDKQLPNLAIELPDHTKFQALSDDMNQLQREQFIGRKAEAERLNGLREEEENKRNEARMNDVTVAGIIAKDVKQFDEEENSSLISRDTTEHKTAVPVSTSHRLARKMKMFFSPSVTQEMQMPRDITHIIRGYVGEDFLFSDDQKSSAPPRQEFVDHKKDLISKYKKYSDGCNSMLYEECCLEWNPNPGVSFRNPGEIESHTPYCQHHCGCPDNRGLIFCLATTLFPVTCAGPCPLVVCCIPALVPAAAPFGIVGGTCIALADCGMFSKFKIDIYLNEKRRKDAENEREKEINKFWNEDLGRLIAPSKM